MGKGLKVMIVLTFILVLVLAVFLLWKELTRPQEATTEAEEPGAILVTEGKVLYKTPEEWKPILEERFQSLKSLLNKKDWDGVAKLYGRNVVVHAKPGNKKFKGGKEIAEKFWRKKFDARPGLNIIGFEIEVAHVFSVDIPTELLKKSDRLNQLVVFRGVLTTEASPEESVTFEGLAGHIEDCPNIILGEMY